MDEGIIARRYARALLEYTRQAKVSEQVYNEMSVLAQHFADEPRLRRVLANPILGQTDKIALLKTAAGENPTPQTMNFIGLVVRKHRETLLQEIALSYLTLYRESRNIKQATLETAVPMSPEMQEHIRELIVGKTKGEVELSLCVNPELIGGFIFRMDYRQIDASVRTRLAEIKKQFIEENRRII